MIRIQFDIPEDKNAELEKLMEDTGIRTKKELLNNALSLFQWAVRERKAGNTIAAVDEENNLVKELVMSSLS